MEQEKKDNWLISSMKSWAAPWWFGGIISVAAIAVTITWNQRAAQVELLKTKLEQQEKEAESLRQLHPSDWEKRFNEQEEYYESQMQRRQIEIDQRTHVIDSLQVLRYLGVALKRKICFSNAEANHILAMLERGNRDSIRVELLQKALTNLDTALDVARQMDRNSRAIIALQDKHISELYQDKRGWITNSFQYRLALSLGILLLVAGTITSFLQAKRRAQMTGLKDSLRGPPPSESDDPAPPPLPPPSHP